MAAGSEKCQRMQRAGHGSKLHGIGDDGDGAMCGRYSVVCEALELKLREQAFGSEELRFVFRSMDMLGSIMTVETCVTRGIVDALVRV